MSVSKWAYEPEKCDDVRTCCDIYNCSECPRYGDDCDGDGEEECVELWKPVKGYEGLYEVSNLGRVRKREWKIINGGDHKGYRRIGLWKDGEYKSLLIHRLVAEAFIPNPDNYPVVNHIDECPANNRVDNLEWCTQKHNMNWGTVNKRISENAPNRRAVFSIDKKTGERKHYSSIADAYADVTGGSHTGSISEAASGKRKSAYGKYWYYDDEKGM